jgi:hypothetical protein
LAAPTSINLVVALDEFVFRLPLLGLDVLVLARRSEELVGRIRTRSSTFRAMAANDLLWVGGRTTRDTAVIDPDTLTVQKEFKIGTNESPSTGPQRPLTVGDEIWVQNRGDDALFIVSATDV